MKVILSILLLIILTIKMSETNELEVTKGNVAFSQKMYNILSEENGNLFFSPISLHTILSLLLQGSKGSTSKALQSALKISQPQSAADGYEKIMGKLNSAKDIKLLMANKVYIKDGFKLNENFKQIATKQFSSQVQDLDFNKKKEAANIMNNWVSNKTENKIKDLLSENDLDPNTAMVMINAIYFKGDWKHKFNPQSTQDLDFFINEKDSVKVPMMFISKKLRFIEDEKLDVKILELPYKNEDFSMVILLPNKKTGLKDLENKLEGININELMNSLWQVQVEVTLPKFKIETKMDLKETLNKLGLEILFDPQNANLTGLIEGDLQLFVSKAIQKAFVEVNEEGAEAAAATGLVVLLASAPVPIPKMQFTADHPFIFMIVHKTNDGKLSIPLFMGKLTKF